MSLLFYSDTDDPAPWRKALARTLPELEFRVWPDTGSVQDVRYALVWNPPQAIWQSLPRLKAILSLGAGVDHLLGDPTLPTAVPIVRMVDAGLAAQMSEYALYGVLHFHRNMHHYAEQQWRGEWRPHPAVLPSRRMVGVMGLGVLGGDFVRKLAPFGFDVLGWSRRPRQIPGIWTFNGPSEFGDFLSRSQILVNFLPLTPETKGILSTRAFRVMPRGACIVNLARGAHLNEDDLLAALESGQVGGAMLDVFQSEPLAPGHLLWSHPRVVITPHIAAQAIAELMVSQVVDSIQKIERGEAPLGLIDPLRGY
jgi:glyoxylate/hydroxypyruvate reductase A